MSTCPIAFERLVDACAGELSRADEEALEEHVFACEACGDAYARVTRMLGALRALIPPVITQDRLTRLRDRGTPLTFTPVAAGARVAVRFAPNLDLLVHALRGDLTAATRIDLALETLDGAPLIAFENVPFDRDRGEVLIACQRHFYELGFPTEIRFRLHVHSADGQRAVEDYVVDHELG